MNWTAIGFDWNHVRAFLAVAEEGSFSAAAAALRTTQPTVGRQIAALEQQLGVVLLQRTGNQQVLTAAGLELIEHVRHMGEAAHRVSLAATGQAEALEGVVIVTASELISAYLLGPALAVLRRDHPGITVEIVASNAVRDLQRREADIAIRNVAPQHAELIGKKVAQRSAGMYATPGYLEQIGGVSTLADLQRASFFAFDHSEQMMAGLAQLGLVLSARHFPVVTSNHLVQWQLARQGLGICFVMEQVGDADPAMVRVLPEFPPFPVPIWLTSHREVRTSQRVRVVFDALARALAD